MLRIENLFRRLVGRLYAIVSLLMEIGLPCRFVISLMGWLCGGFVTVECHSLWMVEGFGSSGWNWRWKNSLLWGLGFIFCLLVWFLNMSAFWWADLKSGSSWELV